MQRKLILGNWKMHGSIESNFGRLLSDQQIATRGHYVLEQYGNPDASVTVQQVQTLRQGGEASPLILIARVGMALAVLIVLAMVVLLIRRR